MSPRVFFCFDYQRDYARALQMREALGYPDDDVHGFFAATEVAELDRLGDVGLRGMVRDHIRHTDVTVILIGTQTAKVRWIQYAIERSVKRHNAFTGLFVHTVPDEQVRVPIGATAARQTLTDPEDRCGGGEESVSQR